MNRDNSIFDQDETLHLAIDAAGRGDHGAALAYLKKGAERFPRDARIAYMLGAEHAQIGLYDRAEAEMGRAVELEPTLYTACFQLGLLQLTLGKIDAARATWIGLDALPAEHALRQFRSGLEELVLDRFGDARKLIEQGLAANNFSPDLNRDMEGVLARIADLGEGTEAPAATDATGGHMWLSAYNTDQTT